ncbi:MAG: hypothetical protein PHI68_02370 [Candidatus Cloacimonetes bacterium]|nr:hypothetical protein [Candidatus Cloacimonadota bacterium]
MGKYSIHGSDAFDSKIDAILEDIRTRVLDIFPQDKLKALILSGGYGRGEGGVLIRDGQEELYNDLDLFVITGKLKRKTCQFLTRQLTALHHELSEKHGIDVDFSPLQAYTVLPKAEQWLVWYDLKMGHKVLFGNPRILSYLPDWKAEELPLMEALKLLLNRGVGLKLAETNLKSDKPDHDFIRRNIHKAIQALGDSLLIANGLYRCSNLERMEIWQSRKDLTSQIGPISNDDNWLYNQYITSMEFKLKPCIETLERDATTKWIKETRAMFKQTYYFLWKQQASAHKYTWQENTPYQSYLQYLSKSFRVTDSIHIMLRNLLHNLKFFKGTCFSPDLYLRYPRYRLFYTLPYFLFDEEGDVRNIGFILSLQGFTSLRDLWERFLKIWYVYN